YFEPVEGGQLRETTTAFHLRGFIPMTGAANDPDLTPEFPGITDKLDIRDWKPPFRYDNTRIKPGDQNDKFWKAHRTTPKAYVTLGKGQELWSSRFGRLTSVRLAPEKPLSDAKLKELSDNLASSLLHRLRPEDGGFVWQDLRSHGQQASSGGTDFAQLFLGFSCFLI